MEAFQFFIQNLGYHEGGRVFFFFVLDPKQKTSSWSLDVIPDMTEVFVECKVQQVFCRDVQKYSNELLTSPCLLLLYIGAGLKGE